MASRKQQFLSDYIDAVHGGLFDAPIPRQSSIGWTLFKDKDILYNPPPPPKWKDPDRFDYRILIPIYGFTAMNPAVRNLDDAAEFAENTELSIISNLVKAVIDSEPKPNPKELNAVLAMLCDRYFKDPEHLANPSDDTGKYDFAKLYHPHWSGNTRDDIRKLVADHARKGDKKAKMLYDQMRKVGWVPRTKDEMVN
jgi:hypothetical protein